ncbi:MAG: glycosyl hydrolase, partial [Acidimicrobiia bacterium]
MKIDTSLEPESLSAELTRLWDITGPKAKRLCRRDNTGQATPVYTVEGRYTSRGWTEWTQGFLYGQAILQFDATGDEEALELGRRFTRDHMTPHLTHQGVHDHGFNNVSTYGNLRRLMLEGRIPLDAWELTSYENALRVSGAVQAMRWTATADGGGFIHSFNGPHSLFCDTIRS